MKEQLMSIKSQLISQIEGQMGNLQCVDTKELGEVIDMVKDIEEAIYYCTITEAMDKKDSEEMRGQNNYYYTEKLYPYRDMDKEYGRMYYDGNGSQSSSGANMSGTNHYSERPYPMISHDMREGRSPANRRNYMETKAAHGDKKSQMQELDQYLSSLSTDLIEMIQDSSPEEKQMVQTKLTSIANKLN